MADITQIKEGEFQKEVLEASGPTLTYFWAEWCNPCKTMGPIYEEFATEAENIKLVKVNVDDNQSVAQQYNVMSIPTFLLFKNGQVAAQNVGSMTKDQLKEFAKQ